MVVIGAVKQLAIGWPDFQQQQGTMAHATLGRVQPPHDMVEHRRFPHAARAIDQQIGTAGGLPDRVQDLLLDLVEQGMPRRTGFALVKVGLDVCVSGAIGLRPGEFFHERYSSYTWRVERSTGALPGLSAAGC